MSFKRNPRGNTIIETGPVLLVLLIMIFFPMLDLLGLAMGYMMVSIYHDYTIRELSCRVPYPPGGPYGTPGTGNPAAIAKVKNDFTGTGFFHYLGIQDSDIAAPIVTYVPETTDPTFVKSVICTTTVTISPLISIPFLPPIQGLNQAVPFTFTTERPQEEKGRN